jgi:dethiobiotin synthetase
VSRIVFITGTDTGVGKTTVTALLLAHALSRGEVVRAVKPLSSGDREDEALLGGLQGAADINFAHFDLPISPWSAARRSKIEVREEMLLVWLRRQSDKCDLLLIEGAGGLLTPLGEGFNALDLIEHLSAEVIIVARDKLGVLNQILLVFSALASRLTEEIKIVLVAEEKPDISAQTNLEDIRELILPVEVLELPWLGNLKPDLQYFRAVAARLDDTLARLLGKKNPPDTEPRGFFP